MHLPDIDYKKTNKKYTVCPQPSTEGKGEFNYDMPNVPNRATVSLGQSTVTK